jgi:hypothetical protein
MCASCVRGGSELAAKVSQAALELADLEMQAPAHLAEAWDGSLILGNFLAGTVERQGMLPRLLSAVALDAASDQHRQAGHEILVALEPLLRCGTLKAGLAQGFALPMQLALQTQCGLLDTGQRVRFPQPSAEVAQLLFDLVNEFLQHDRPSLAPFILFAGGNFFFAELPGTAT